MVTRHKAQFGQFEYDRHLEGGLRLLTTRFDTKFTLPMSLDCKNGILVKKYNYSEQVKARNLKQNQSDYFMYETEYFTRWPV